MSDNVPELPVTSAQLLRAALWYAKHGWHVLPLRPRTKDPFKAIGVYQATTDVNQIEAWWSEWPNANIGIHVGASGLLAFDADAYKDTYDGENFLTLEEQNTITNLTGGGGTHLIYKMPDGEKFGNARGNLPKGIDIKGVGGYIVAPPSVHPSGRIYQWETGYGPHEIDPTPLPAKLLKILREAQSAPSTPATFGESDLPRPDLAKWNLSGRIVQLIFEGHASADRSTTDQSVITALVNKGASDDEIRALFQHFPIGTQGRYAEPDQGDRYLALSIGKARAYVRVGGAPPMMQTEARPSVNGHGAAGLPSETPGERPSHLDEKLTDAEPGNPLGPNIFLAASADDEGNAQCVKAFHGTKYLYCGVYGWMENTGTHWRADGESEAHLNRSITETLIARRMAAVQAGEAYEHIVKACKPSARNKREAKSQFADIATVDVGLFDADPDVLNCRNGVLDLRTGELVAHGPSNRFTYCLPVDYAATADSTLWINFLATVVKDYDAIRDWLQMALGYSITGRTSEECMFYVFGPTRSGKGTLTSTMLTLLGSPLSRGVDFSTFTRKRDGDTQNFDLAPLRPARFVSASESGKHASLNEAAVKTITGNDPITASFKYHDPFSFVPRFKVWLASNHPVRGDVDDDAFWGRVRVIQFPNSFLGHEDKGLKSRMLQPETLCGVLAWMVAGAHRWYNEAQGLITPVEVQSSTQQQRDELDNVRQWLNECCARKEGNFVTNKTLYGSYETWCEENGHTPKKAVGFGRSLVGKGLEATVRKVQGAAQRGFVGLLLRAPDVSDGEQ